MLLSTLPHRAITLGLICAVTACSTKRQARAHPPLALHHRPTREVQSLFLDDKQFQAHQASDPEAIKKLSQNLGTGLTKFVLVVGLTGLGLAFSAGGANAVPLFLAPLTSKDDSWPDGLDASHTATSHLLQVTFHGENIVHARMPTKSKEIFVQARGQARVKVVDTHGSYYARADEIQFRPDLQVVLLRGRVSLSAVNAPDLKSFGLLRIDLARCQAFYTGSGSSFQAQ